MGEAGIDFVMAVIELDRPEFVSRGNDAVHLGDFGRFPGFRVSAAEGANKAMGIGHVADELNGIIDGLTDGRGRREKDQCQRPHHARHIMGRGS